MEVSDWKDFSPSSTEPSVRIGSMTFGTASVSAGMIGITLDERSGCTGSAGPQGPLFGTQLYPEVHAGDWEGPCRRSAPDTRPRDA